MSKKKKNSKDVKTSNFIRNRIDEDIKNNKNNGNVHTRFPPEPNGFLHIGHAKSILLNYGIAQDYKGKFNLRFDDTNPDKEETAYVEAIKKDVKWLGANWEDRLFFSSDYFEKLHNYAIELIKMGKAFVCDLTFEEMREYRGTLKEPGKNSPFRERSIEENLELFEKMKNGEFEEGEKVLRAKIDMTHPSLTMRDPIIYRIKKIAHHRSGDKWNIYPMYDFTHCISDAIEGITHSLCTIEFEEHRLLYDWFLDTLNVEHHPQQIEFARLNITNTIMSKRKLLRLVKENYIESWDDPRLPTISGFRRLGYTPSSIKTFCNKIGVAKSNSTVDKDLLKFCIREELNDTATRRMVVLDPLKVVITNYPDDKVEYFDGKNNPGDSESGTRKIPFSKEIYIEREDFMEDAPKKFFRLAPGKEVRLKSAYYIKCEEVVKDDDGKIVELKCTYDPETRGGWFKGIRKVKGTLHWVSAPYCIDIETRLYDELFLKEDPEDVSEDGDFTDNINPNSLEVKIAKSEPAIKGTKPYERFQFLRKGYFCCDEDSTEEKIIFNRTVSLKDSWKKIKKKMKK